MWGRYKVISFISESTHLTLLNNTPCKPLPITKRINCRLHKIPIIPKPLIQKAKKTFHHPSRKIMSRVKFHLHPQSMNIDSPGSKGFVNSAAVVGEGNNAAIDGGNAELGELRGQ